MRVFKEEQRFTQLWIIVVLVMSTIVPLALFARAYANNQMSLQDVIIASTLILASCFFIFVFKLTTKIDKAGIHYKFSPVHFSFKLIKWNDMEEVYTRKYDAISEFGGWGFKVNPFRKKNKSIALNIAGDDGIQILTKEGKQILIGTQQLTKVNQSIKYYTKNNETDV
ncbi:hypothetical protein [Tenacibaculum sp. 190524A05c]|uniref:hypothetical protein n=1 Tax=Tenacibaculum platacis TaxID=3137852 RepID=UPI0032B1D7D9